MSPGAVGGGQQPTQHQRCSVFLVRKKGLRRREKILQVNNCAAGVDKGDSVLRAQDY